MTRATGITLTTNPSSARPPSPTPGWRIRTSQDASTRPTVFRGRGRSRRRDRDEHLLRCRRTRRPRVRQCLCAPLRRAGPLLRVHGVVREASVSRAAADSRPSGGVAQPLPDRFASQREAAVAYSRRPRQRSSASSLISSFGQRECFASPRAGTPPRRRVEEPCCCVTTGRGRRCRFASSPIPTARPEKSTRRLHGPLERTTKFVLAGVASRARRRHDCRSRLRQRALGSFEGSGGASWMIALAAEPRQGASRSDDSAKRFIRAARATRRSQA